MCRLAGLAGWGLDDVAMDAAHRSGIRHGEAFDAVGVPNDVGLGGSAGEADRAQPMIARPVAGGTRYRLQIALRKSRTVEWTWERLEGYTSAEGDNRGCFH